MLPQAILPQDSSHVFQPGKRQHDVGLEAPVRDDVDVDDLGERLFFLDRVVRCTPRHRHDARQQPAAGAPAPVPAAAADEQQQPQPQPGPQPQPMPKSSSAAAWQPSATTSDMTINSLRRELSRRRLPVTGHKEELAARLATAMAAGTTDLAT